MATLEAQFLLYISMYQHDFKYPYFTKFYLFVYFPPSFWMDLRWLTRTQEIEQDQSKVNLRRETKLKPREWNVGIVEANTKKKVHPSGLEALEHLQR